ncbi:MAG: DUF309 domain-containing protein [Pirellulales bacterium]|nr:DUF309 domain-containing protein [Pirellulales bacterium]
MRGAEGEHDPLYLQGIAYFNACEFFEAHEVWEELWKNTSGEPQLFYKGLIQAAVALHHFGNGNVRGARKVYGSSREYLRRYSPFFQGLDVDKFLSELEVCFAEIESSDEESCVNEIDPELIPGIWLDPPVELPSIETER